MSDVGKDVLKKKSWGNDGTGGFVLFCFCLGLREGEGRKEEKEVVGGRLLIKV